MANLRPCTATRHKFTDPKQRMARATGLAPSVKRGSLLWPIGDAPIAAIARQPTCWLGSCSLSLTFRAVMVTRSSYSLLLPFALPRDLALAPTPRGARRGGISPAASNRRRAHLQGGRTLARRAARGGRAAQARGERRLAREARGQRSSLERPPSLVSWRSKGNWRLGQPYPARSATLSLTDRGRTLSSTQRLVAYGGLLACLYSFGLPEG
jgi:hypothetical protein